MKEMLKKFWFVILAGILLCVGIVYFAMDQSEEVLPGKKVNGQSVVYSIGETDVTADDFYDQLVEQIGPAGVFQFIQRNVLDSAVETTDEIVETAKINVDTVTAQFQSSYGVDYESVLLEAVKQVGYSELSDLEAYFIESAKYEIFSKQTIEENFDAVKDTSKPRILSHILVMMEDSANPTEEELAKVQSVDDALAAGTAFGDVATEFSDDSSASAKGFLGYADVNTSFVPEFLAASLELKDGEVSEWVKTDYGYHLIQCNASDIETLKTYTEFYDGIATNNPTLIAEALWSKAVEMGVTFADPEMEAKILSYIGIEGGAQ